MICTGEWASPLGKLRLAWREERLLSLDYEEYGERFAELLRPQGGGTRATQPPHWLMDPLEAYFGGDLGAVDRIDCSFRGTEFENTVWRMLRTIGPGETATYGALAARLGKPGAARAVGRANSLNPIAIVVPCHRVAGANGKLTGYAGGLERKRWLLDHERRYAPGRADSLRLPGM